MATDGPAAAKTESTPNRCANGVSHDAHFWDSGFTTPYWCPGIPGESPKPAPENWPLTPDHRIRSVVSFTLPSTGERWHWPMDRSSVDVFVEILDLAHIESEARHG